MRVACSSPLPPLLSARGLCALLGQGGPFLLQLLASRWVPALPFLGPPPGPLLRSMGARCWVGGPPLFPPLDGCTHEAHATVRGVFLPRHWLLACHALGSHAARFRPPPPSPSCPVRLTPLWSHGRPRSLDPPHQPDQPQSLSSPVSHTLGAVARRDQA